MKRLICVLLTLSLLFCSFVPMTGAAEIKAVTSAELYVRSDIAGMSTSDYRKIVQIKSKGLEFYVWNQNALFAIEDGAGSVTNFEEGKNYTLSIYLKADSSDYYVISENFQGVNVNGSEATYTVRTLESGLTYICVTYHITASKQTSVYFAFFEFLISVANAIVNFLIDIGVIR